MSRVSVFIFCLALGGCGAWSAPDSATSGVEPHTRADEMSIESRSQWAFSGVLNGLNSNTHFVLAGRFLSAQGSSVTLHSNFNGFRFRDGVIVALKLDDKKFTASLSAPGALPHVVDLPFEWLTSDSRFKLRIEIHNHDASGIRVLMWNYSISQQGEVQNPRPFIAESNADFDSRKQQWIFLEHGHGVHWGLEFENAKISLAYREAPYVP